MSFLRGFDDILEEGVRLAGLTTIGIGGPAEVLARPRTYQELSRLLAAASGTGTPVRILGAGSNILAADEGVGGVVVQLTGKAFSTIRLLPGGLECGAGAGLPRLVREAARAGLSGLEGLVGIPASVGGALIMNAGGRYGTIGDAVQEVEAMGMDGAQFRLRHEAARFSYRSSELRGLAVLGCTLTLTPDSPEAVGSRTAAVLAEKRACQPLGAASAGCVFKNPPGGPPAGRIVEELGFKGRKVGGAMVSEQHANYIVNAGGATCGDVLELVDTIRESVLRERGVELELEVEVWS